MRKIVAKSISVIVFFAFSLLPADQFIASTMHHILREPYRFVDGLRHTHDYDNADNKVKRMISCVERAFAERMTSSPSLDISQYIVRSTAALVAASCMA